MNLESEMEIAADIARETGQVLLSYFGTDRAGAQSKGSRDVVTAADLAGEALLLQRLQEAFPGDGIVGEEGGTVSRTGNRRWFVDPLDGTLNYSRGIPVWSVSLALFDGDQPVVGVVHDPIRREAFCAAAGRGAWYDGSRIRCSGETDLLRAVVHLTVDFNDQSMLQGLEDLQALAPGVLRTRNLGSAALALAYVAAGRFDAMLHRFAHPWDYGAGVLLVREAGGYISDLDGRPYTKASFSVLAAATPTLHAGLVDLLPASRAGPS